MQRNRPELGPEGVNMQRALFELRAGRGVCLTRRGESLAFVAAESLEELSDSCLCVISGEQADSLGLPSGILALDGTELERLLRQETPQVRAVHPLPELAQEMLALLKMAGLLPVALLAQEGMALEADTVAAFPQDQLFALRAVSEAEIPLAGAGVARLVVFRSALEPLDHLALIWGEPEAVDAPLVRVHSSCLTGDVLGSLRCDCGEQLQGAIVALSQAGAGVLVYLNQEGRGIGLASKMRAYRLQNGGMDTHAANERLGYAADERHFGLAAAMLRGLGVQRVRLLTNNPGKLQGLEAAGIEVVERVPLVAEAGAHNAAYLQAKSRFGHLL